jgi:PAS domain S-box-containing protein
MEKVKITLDGDAFERFFELIPDLACIAATDGYFKRINRVWEQTLGFKLEELLGQPLASFIHPDDVGPTSQEIERQRGGESTIRFTNRYRTKQGSYRWLEWNGSPSEDGSVLYAVARDITERKQAEEKLRESTARFHSLFEDSPIAIWEEDFSLAKAEFDHLRQAGITNFRDYWTKYPQEMGKLAGLIQIIEINQASVKMVGAENKEQVKKHLPDYFTEESMQVFKEEMIALVEGRTEFKAEIPIRNIRGESIILELTLNVQQGFENSLERVLVSFIDVTQRKQAEEALLKSEEKYRLLIETADDVILQTDLQGRHLYRNGAYYTSLGYEVGADIEMDGYARVHPDDVQVMKDAQAELMRTGKSVSEYRVRHRDGHWVYRQSKTVVLYDAEHKPESFLAIIRDVTERKQADAALRESEEHLRMALQKSEIVLFNQDMELRYTWIYNPNREFTPESVLGKTDFELLPLEEANLLIEIKRSVLETGISHRQDVRTTIGGKPFHYTLSVEPLRDQQQKIVGVTCVSIDITERKQAEEALRLLAQDLKEAQLVAHLGSWKWDIEKREITWSDEMYRIFGIDKNCYTGRLGDVIAKVIHPDDLHIVLPSNAATIVREPVEYRIILPDGSIRHIWAKSGESIMDDAGKPIFLTGIAQDITERKRAEEALHRQQQENLLLISKLDQAQKIAKIGNWDWDLITDKVWWSDETYRIFGVSRASYVPSAKNNARYYHPEDLEPFTKQVFTTLDTGIPLETDLRLILDNGQLKHCYTKALVTLGESGKPIHLAGIIMDITERKQAEEALREKSLQLQMALDAARIGIHEWDVVNNRFFWDERIYEFWGLPVGTPITLDLFTQGVHPDDRARVQAAIDPLFDPQGDENYFIQYRVIGIQTSIQRWLELSGKMFFDNNRPVRFIGTAIDITKRKQAEEQVKKSLAEKETLLRELYHRTKNNMAVIVALLEMQSNYFDDERLQMAFTEAGNRIRSMLLVHQKLYEAQDLSHLNLKDYIENLAAILIENYHVSPGQVSIISEMNNVFVLIDTAVPCGLILNELISNTLKYAFPAGRHGTITIKLHRVESGEIHLSVSDDGTGMPPGFDIRQDGHLGLNNIFLLGEDQLKAQVTFSTQPGVTCELIFRDNLYEPRV